MVKRSLEYAQEAETKKSHLRELRKVECNGETGFKETREVLLFLSRTRWTSEQNQDGGITWLELYIWYRTHKIDDNAKLLRQKFRSKAKLPISKDMSAR